MRVAIISFFHYESSICLAKYLTKPDCEIDYYLLTDFLRDKGCVSSINYYEVKNKIGLTKLDRRNFSKIIDFFKEKNLNFFMLKIFSFSPKFELLNKIIIYLFVTIKIRKKYDCVNIVGQNELITYFNDLLKKENLTHTVHEVSGHGEKKMEMSPLIRNIIKHQSKVIFQSQSTYNRFIDLLQSNEIKINNDLYEVINFGLFETYKIIEPINPPHLKINSKNVFLFYGAIKPYKGLSFLKDVIKLLDSKTLNYQLIIAGYGEDESFSFFKSHSNTSIINKYLTNEELVFLIQNSKCIICPYLSASQSGIISTTFLFKKPIIATNVGDFKESIINGKNGILVNAGEADKFAEAMYKMITDEHLLHNLKTNLNNFEQSNQNYSWEFIAQKTINFLLK